MIYPSLTKISGHDSQAAGTHDYHCERKLPVMGMWLSIPIAKVSTLEQLSTVYFLQPFELGLCLMYWVKINQTKSKAWLGLS